MGVLLLQRHAFSSTAKFWEVTQQNCSLEGRKAILQSSSSCFNRHKDPHHHSILERAGSGECAFKRCCRTPGSGGKLLKLRANSTSKYILPTGSTDYEDMLSSVSELGSAARCPPLWRSWLHREG